MTLAKQWKQEEYQKGIEKGLLETGLSFEEVKKLMS